MNRRSSWLWILLFILGVILLGTLATSWNVVILRDHRRWVEFTRDSSAHTPIWGIVLGTLGFIGAIAGLILFFLKVRKEMQINEAQSEFLASVTHELKTPLATLELACAALRAPHPPTQEHQAKLWGSIDAELRRLREDVESLLAAAQLQIAPHPPVHHKFSLDAWLTEAEPRWRKILGPDASLELSRESPLGLVDLDSKMLATITDNLIDNARKFATGRPTVSVQLVRSPRAYPLGPARFRLSFQDAGKGFDHRTGSKLFKRFYRARKKGEAPIPGTGLGLYLAHAAASALKLDLSAFSEGPGKGATFTLEGNLAE